jgi:pyridinium-3,5-biscarboxylic acid mononucleotide sulfurtransferase
LRDLGFHEVRVRHHELSAASLARIELGVDEIPRLLEGELFQAVSARLKEIGYAHVTLDLAGYRRGSVNERPIAFGLHGKAVGRA